MKILAISDTHNKHNLLMAHETIEEHGIDTLIHCGDFSNNGSISEFEDFIFWWNRLEVKNKILVPGNHDFCMVNARETLLKSHGAEMRNTTLFTGEEPPKCIDGVTFWGTPYTGPSYGRWAFMYDAPDVEQVWKHLKPGIDVLVTHGPPGGILDMTWRGVSIGSLGLREKLESMGSTPKIHLFGHNHLSAGQSVEGLKFFIPTTKFYNCAVLADDHSFHNKGTVLELDI